MSSRQSGRRRSGWTLVELALVFIVVSLVIGVAAPRMSEVLSGAKTSAGEQDLLAVAAAVDQFTMRAGTAAIGHNIAWSFNRVGGNPNLTPRQTNGYEIVNPWDVLNSIMPRTFDGVNNFGQAYDAYIEQRGTDSVMWVLSCVPVGEYKDYTPVNPRVGLDCSAAICGASFCAMTFEERIVPGRVTEDVKGETTLLYSTTGAPPPSYSPGTTVAPPPPPPSGK